MAMMALSGLAGDPHVYEGLRGRWRNTLEVACHRPTLEAFRLRGATSRLVARIIAGFHHHHVHSGLCRSLCCLVHQCFSDASALVLRVDGLYVDFTHVVIGVQPGAHPADGVTVD